MDEIRAVGAWLRKPEISTYPKFRFSPPPMIAKTIFLT